MWRVEISIPGSKLNMIPIRIPFDVQLDDMGIEQVQQITKVIYDAGNKTSKNSKG